MVCVVISVGTNIDRENNLKAALAALRHTYGALRMSPVFSNPAVGFTGPEFYNLVVSFETTQTVTEVTTFLHGVEANQGRTRQGDRLDSRELDLDLLLYGDVVAKSIPRDEIERYAFVLRPLAELAPEVRHPLSGISMRTLWARFDASSEQLSQVQVEFACA